MLLIILTYVILYIDLQNNDMETADCQ